MHVSETTKITNVSGMFLLEFQKKNMEMEN
jgi:hypothetical protein